MISKWFCRLTNSEAVTPCDWIQRCGWASQLQFRLLIKINAGWNEAVARKHFVKSSKSSFLKERLNQRSFAQASKNIDQHNCKHEQSCRTVHLGLNKKLILLATLIKQWNECVSLSVYAYVGCTSWLQLWLWGPIDEYTWAKHTMVWRSLL